MDEALRQTSGQDDCGGVYFIGMLMSTGYRWWYTTNSSTSGFLNFKAYIVPTPKVYCAVANFTDGSAPWYAADCGNRFCVLCEKGQ